MNRHDPFTLLTKYHHWLEVIGNQIQRSPQQSITVIQIETDPTSLPTFDEIPQFYAKRIKNTLVVHEYYKEEFTAILQYHAILHLIPPEYEQHPVLAILLFLFYFAPSYFAKHGSERFLEIYSHFENELIKIIQTIGTASGHNLIAKDQTERILQTLPFDQFFHRFVQFAKPKNTDIMFLNDLFGFIQYEFGDKAITPPLLELIIRYDELLRNNNIIPSAKDLRSRLTLTTKDELPNLLLLNNLSCRYEINWKQIDLQVLHCWIDLSPQIKFEKINHFLHQFIFGILTISNIILENQFVIFTFSVPIGVITAVHNYFTAMVREHYLVNFGIMTKKTTEFLVNYEENFQSFPFYRTPPPYRHSFFLQEQKLSSRLLFTPLHFAMICGLRNISSESLKLGFTQFMRNLQTEKIQETFGKSFLAKLDTHHTTFHLLSTIQSQIDPQDTRTIEQMLTEQKRIHSDNQETIAAFTALGQICQALNYKYAKQLSGITPDHLKAEVLRFQSELKWTILHNTALNTSIYMDLVKQNMIAAQCLNSIYFSLYNTRNGVILFVRTKYPASLQPLINHGFYIIHYGYTHKIHEYMIPIPIKYYSLFMKWLHSAHSDRPLELLEFVSFYKNVGQDDFLIYYDYEHQIWDPIKFDLSPLQYLLKQKQSEFLTEIVAPSSPNRLHISVYHTFALNFSPKREFTQLALIEQWTARFWENRDTALACLQQLFALSPTAMEYSAIDEAHFDDSLTRILQTAIAQNSHAAHSTLGLQPYIVILAGCDVYLQPLFLHKHKLLRSLFGPYLVTQKWRGGKQNSSLFLEYYFPTPSSSGINLILHLEHLLDLLQSKYPLRVYHFAVASRRQFFNDTLLQPQDFHLAEYSYLTPQNLHADIDNPNMNSTDLFASLYNVVDPYYSHEIWEVIGYPIEFMVTLPILSPSQYTKIQRVFALMPIGIAFESVWDHDCIALVAFIHLKENIRIFVNKMSELLGRLKVEFRIESMLNFADMFPTHPSVRTMDTFLASLPRHPRTARYLAIPIFTHQRHLTYSDHDQWLLQQLTQDLITKHQYSLGAFKRLLHAAAIARLETPLERNLSTRIIMTVLDRLTHLHDEPIQFVA